MAEKPLMFGDQSLTPKDIEDMRSAAARWDASYVPGYSEAHRENDVRAGEGKRPIDMPRLQWVRITNVRGEDVGSAEMVDWFHKGYRFCYKQDLETHGWGMPPAATIDAAGRIRRNDQALAIVDAEQARINREDQRAVNASFHGAKASRQAPAGISISETEDSTTRGRLRDFLDS